MDSFCACCGPACGNGNAPLGCKWVELSMVGLPQCWLCLRCAQQVMLYCLRSLACYSHAIVPTTHHRHRSLSFAPCSRATIVAHLQVDAALDIHLMEQRLHAQLIAPELLRSLWVGILVAHPRLARLRQMTAHNATFWHARL